VSRAALACAALAVLLAAGPAAAQVSNGQVERLALAGSLGAEMTRVANTDGDLWAAYRIVLASAMSRMCGDSQQTGRVFLAPAAEAVVLARFEARRLVRMRLVTADCAIDAGGSRVVWFDNVPATESADWLASLTTVTPDRPPAALLNTVVMTLALHDSRDALEHLVRLARQDPRAQVRQKALFWLAHRASANAAATIQQAVDQDPNAQVRAQAVFALSRLPRDQGVPLLIQLARAHRDREVRRKAMFWLGQSQDPRAVAFFEEVLR
jgi:hypothetical protein